DRDRYRDAAGHLRVRKARHVGRGTGAGTLQRHGHPAQISREAAGRGHTAALVGVRRDGRDRSGGMIALVLGVAATSTCTYWLLAALAKRRAAARALRRLVAGPRAQTEARRGLRPVLIQAVDEAKGRMALGILQRLRVKQSADSLLETAGVKWGAAGLA